MARRHGNVDLRSASRGSAKPAPMTPGPADVRAAPPFSCGRGVRENPVMGVSPGEVGTARRRRAESRIAKHRDGSRLGTVPIPGGGVPAPGRASAQSALRRSPRFAGRCRPPPGELAGGRRSLACASLRLVAWAPGAMFSVRAFCDSASAPEYEKYGLGRIAPLEKQPEENPRFGQFDRICRCPAGQRGRRSPRARPRRGGGGSGRRSRGRSRPGTCRERRTR